MKINIINNEIREITSYEDIVKIKLDSCYPIIKVDEYLSMLFNNLGFSFRPDTTNDIKNLIELKNIILSKYLVFPKVYHDNLVFSQNTTTLYNFITVVKNWVVSDVERGHLLDLSKSFKLPSNQEIEFNIKNNINMTRNYSIKSTIDYWNKSDIFIRRSYNISPKIDQEYFNKCLIDFNSVAKQTEIYFPCILFISCILDPDIFFNAIRTAEKEAFNYSYDIIKNKYPYEILINDDILIKPFKFFLNRQIMYIYNIYNKKGYEGFIIKNKNDNKEIFNTQLPVDTENYITIRSTNVGLDQNIINNINNQIFKTILDGDHKSYILQYVDANSLDILNNMGENNIVRKNSYKKLYYTIMQIKESNPELLNRKEKFIFSKPFYVNQEIFALYNKPRNTFFVTFPDLVLREMSPNVAINFYKKYLNIDVKLDFKEMIDSYDSLIVPYINLKDISEDNIQQQKPIRQITSVAQQENSISQNDIQQQIPVQQQNIINNDDKYIGYNIDDVVV